MPGLAAVIDAAQNADDVPAALTRASTADGCEGLRLLAGCWRIGMDRGSMLASVIEGLAEALRDEQSHREEIALQLAGPRATARLLAGLPVLGLGMAAALGAKPLTFLFTTLPGVLCLSLGTTLDAVGLWWTARLATSAEQVQ
jgi:tight adherence protein B